MPRNHLRFGIRPLIARLALAAVIASAVYPGLAHGTTTLGMLYQGKLYLASDSKVYEDSVPLCKIFQIGRLNYAVAGMLDAADYNFSVPKTIRQSYETHHGIKASFHDFTLRIQPRMVAYLNKWSEHDPAKMRRLSKAMNITVTFAGFESDNSATLCAARFVAVPPFIPGNFKVKLEKSQCNNSTDPPPHNENLLPGGDYDGYEQCKTYSSIDPVAIEKCIVEKEIRLHPSQVGPPVSILEISILGSRWISQGVCPNDPAQIPPPPRN